MYLLRLPFTSNNRNFGISWIKRDHLPVSSQAHHLFCPPPFLVPCPLSIHFCAPPRLGREGRSPVLSNHRPSSHHPAKKKKQATADYPPDNM